MFKKLKNLFKKEKPLVSSITLYTEDSGETFVDVRIKDESQDSIDQLALLMSMFDASSFFQVSSVLKKQCMSSQNKELYGKVIESVISQSGTDKFIDNKEPYLDDLCINPSDML
jgi:hypothetical protein